MKDGKYEVGDRVRMNRTCIRTKFYSCGDGGIVVNATSQHSLSVAFDTGDFYRTLGGLSTWALCAYECVLALPTT